MPQASIRSRSWERHPTITSAISFPWHGASWNSAGYINFGAAPGLKQNHKSSSKGRIIVVGAGLAGVRIFFPTLFRFFRQPIILRAWGRGIPGPGILPGVMLI